MSGIRTGGGFTRMASRESPVGRSCNLEQLEYGYEDISITVTSVIENLPQPLLLLYHAGACAAARLGGLKKLGSCRAESGDRGIIFNSQHYRHRVQLAFQSPYRLHQCFL